MQLRAAHYVIQAPVAKGDAFLLNQVRKTFASARTSYSAYFKNIHKVSSEMNLYWQADGGRGVIRDAQLFVEGIPQKQFRSHQVNGSARQYHLIPVQEIHIGEICGEQGIVRPDARTQKQRRLCAQRHRQTGEKTGASSVDGMLNESRTPNTPERDQRRNIAVLPRATGGVLGG